MNDSTRLKKELSLLDVYALATGAALSAGLFLLPGLAAAQAGPAVVFAYLLAAMPLVPAMLSAVELASAMPRAGGTYYFLDRSLGPLAGTVGGFGTWLALTLKASFALVGMGAYALLFFPEAPNWLIKIVAVVFAVIFGLINAYGSKGTGRFQIFLLLGLFSVLLWFMVHGTVSIDLQRFEGFFGKGSDAILAPAGLVYISYVGVTNVLSVSEEVKDPERNLPLGVFLSLGTAVLVYVVCTSVMVGVVSMDELETSLTPMAAAANRFGGKVGMAVISAGALFAFSSVANAGILSSSRYPLAMSRDELLPPAFSRLSKRGTPAFAIAFTVGSIIFFLLALDPIKIAKLASAFQLMIFALLCFAVIVMRESQIDSYDPGYRAPLYPWLQIFGILAPFVLITEMGRLPIFFSGALVAAGAGWYVLYAGHRVRRQGAIYHVFERLGQRRFDDLDRELRSIMKEKGLRQADPFDEVVASASIIDFERPHGFEEIAQGASRALAQKLPCSAEELLQSFLEGTRTGATPVAKGAALPHLRLDDVDRPFLVIARCVEPVRIPTGGALSAKHDSEDTYVLFFLISPENDPGQHLRMLAEIASRVDQDDFLPHLLGAADEHEIKQVLLENDRYIELTITRGEATADLLDRKIRDHVLPDGCLVAAVRRGERTIVPRGDTVLLEGDRILVIGEVTAISELYTIYRGESARATDEG